MGDKRLKNRIIKSLINYAPKNCPKNMRSSWNCQCGATFIRLKNKSWGLTNIFLS